MDKIKVKIERISEVHPTEFYLIVNSKGDFLYKQKTGQLFLYNSLDGALRKVKKDMKRDWLRGKTRIVIKKAVMVNL